MAQLPPKFPTITHHHNWPPASPPHHRMPPLTTINHPSPSPQPPQSPPWVDEFLDYTSARGGFHCRSMSDSIAFLEAAQGGCGGGPFDRLDDEKLMSMFSDDLSAAVPRMMDPPSSPLDQNSNNEENPMSTDNNNNDSQQWQLKTEPGEVESACKSDAATMLAQPPSDNDDQLYSGEASIDPRRVKRILANRQSAQRSRVRKLQYISELEQSITTLQTEVSALSPRVAFLDHQRLILNVDNSALVQRIAALAQDKIFKDAHQEALKKEIERLRQIYEQQQNLEKETTTPITISAATATAQPPPASNHNMVRTDKEQLMT